MLVLQDTGGMEKTVWLVMLLVFYATALEISNVMLANQDIICGKEAFVLPPVMVLSTKVKLL